MSNHDNSTQIQFRRFYSFANKLIFGCVVLWVSGILDFRHLRILIILISGILDLCILDLCILFLLFCIWVFWGLVCWISGIWVSCVLSVCCNVVCCMCWCCIVYAVCLNAGVLYFCMLGYVLLLLVLFFKLPPLRTAHPRPCQAPTPRRRTRSDRVCAVATIPREDAAPRTAWLDAGAPMSRLAA